MNGPSLKNLLDGWSGPPKVGDLFEPRRARAAESEVKKRLGDVEMKEPESYDLDDLYKRIKASWLQDGSLERVSARDLRRLPFVLFYSPTDGNRTRGQGSTNYWLGAQPGIVRAYDQWLSNGQRSGSVREMLKQFLGAYPVDLRTFEDLRQLLRKTVEGGSSPPPSLKKWQQRCLDFGFLEKDGNLSFVNKLVSASDSVDDILSQAGLEEGLERCKFLKSGVRKFLPNISTRLSRDGIDDTQLARMLTLLECEGKLRFEEKSFRVELASALLGPFMDTPPPADTKDQLQSFFQRHFGDPRLPSGKRQWFDVREEVRRVVIRWLVERALEQFFLLVKETALDRHWRYREAFWRAFHLQGMIDDIWFVLGPHAKDFLRKTNKKRDETETSADLRGAQGDQSVLLLRMPGVTIAEWSHNGSCRIWLDDNRDKPRLYESRYYRRDLMSGADFEQAHHGSDRGSWQDMIAGWLRENTGASIYRTHYMPADQSGLMQRRHNVRPHRVRKIPRRTNRPGPRGPTAPRR